MKMVGLRKLTNYEANITIENSVLTPNFYNSQFQVLLKPNQSQKIHPVQITKSKIFMGIL
jgi:hypothetical protein